MKLLITLDFPPEKGGIQNYLYEIVRHTYDAQDLVLVGTANKSVKLTHAGECPIRYHSSWFFKHNKKKSLIILFFYIAKILLRGPRGLIVHSGNLYAAIPLYFLSFFFNFEYGIYCYGGEILQLTKKNGKNRILKMVLRRAAYHYFISDYTRRLLLNLGIEKKLIYAPPKIDISKIPDHIKPPQPPLQLLSVGRLVKHKGHEVLLESVKRLPPKISWNLVIAGNGPELPQIKGRITENLLSEKVVVACDVSDEELSQLYQQSHIFLLPSLETSGATEGFGIVMLEAMSYNIPVIASRVGGVPEVLLGGAAGLLVSPGDPDDLASAIVKLSASEKLRENLVHTARDNLLKNYCW